MAFKGLEHLVESRIQASIARGDFDRLPGRGKPLKDDDLSGLGREERLGVLLARCAGSAPEEVKLLRQIAELREAVARAPEGAARRKLVKALRDATLRLSVLFEVSGKHVLVNLLNGPEQAGNEPSPGTSAETRPPRGR
ncbi:DUF1992 domain-containing protein [Sorangium sp. So ce233]|uniref:DnaJ family domain-containing protein n=1 Tax=Sorangium sp. So ce233 TaxID=3133290 RepID=UPI003F6024BE